MKDMKGTNFEEWNGVWREDNGQISPKNVNRIGRESEVWKENLWASEMDWIGKEKGESRRK